MSNSISFPFSTALDLDSHAETNHHGQEMSRVGSAAYACSEDRDLKDAIKDEKWTGTRLTDDSIQKRERLAGCTYGPLQFRLRYLPGTVPTP
jgi:hypothetical protein